MGVSDLDPDALGRRLWNSGNMVGAKRPLNPRDVCLPASAKWRRQSCDWTALELHPAKLSAPRLQWHMNPNCSERRR